MFGINISGKNNPHPSVIPAEHGDIRRRTIRRRTRNAGIISGTGVQQWTVPVNTLHYLTGSTLQTKSTWVSYCKGRPSFRICKYKQLSIWFYLPVIYISENLRFNYLLRRCCDEISFQVHFNPKNIFYRRCNDYLRSQYKYGLFRRQNDFLSS